MSKKRALLGLVVVGALGLVVVSNLFCGSSARNVVWVREPAPNAELAGAVETASYPLLDDAEELTLHFHNFHPESEEAKRGLDAIYRNTVLGIKGGLSVHVLSNISKIPLLESYGQMDKLGDPAYQWRTYGYVPSPPSRSSGKLPGQRYFPLQASVYNLGDAGYVAEEERGILTLSCLTCHSGVVAGHVIAGAASNYADFRRYLIDDENLRALQNAIKLNPLRGISSHARFGMTELELGFLDLELDYFEQVLAPMLEAQVTRGAITGPASVLTYLTRVCTNEDGGSILDAQRHATELPVREDMEGMPHPMPPVDPNPWWTIKYKSTLYVYPETQSDSFDQVVEYFMQRHIGVTDRIAEAHQRVVEDVLLYAMETKAPPYPWPLDAERVARGSKIFHEKRIEARSGATCAACHGRYQTVNGKLNVDYTDYYTDVGTDRAVFEVGRYIMYKTLERVDPSEVPNYLPYRQRPGYPAQPLVGVWASAPYLHNGSVPTLYHVLKASSRPRRWARSFDPRAYDQEKGGFQVLDPKTAEDSGLVYDSDKPGYGNMGHDFAESWDDETVYDVVEFLKSLNQGRLDGEPGGR